MTTAWRATIRLPRVTDGPGQGDRGLRRRQPLHRVPGEHQGPPERGRAPGPGPPMRRRRSCPGRGGASRPPGRRADRGSASPISKPTAASAATAAGAELGGDLERLQARAPGSPCTTPGAARRCPARRAPRRARPTESSGRARRRGGRPPRRRPPPASPGRPPGGRSRRPCRAGRWARRRRSGGPGRRAPGAGRPRRRTRSRGPGRGAGAARRRPAIPASTVSRTMECSNRWISASPAMPASSPAATSSATAASSSSGARSGGRLEDAQVDPLAARAAARSMTRRADGDKPARRTPTTSRTLSGTAVAGAGLTTQRPPSRPTPSDSRGAATARRGRRRCRRCDRPARPRVRRRSSSSS